MTDLAVLAGAYLKEKLLENLDVNVQALAQIIYIDSEIGKAQKKIFLTTASGINDDVNPKTDIDLQVICTDISISKAKETALIVNNVLDGLYDVTFEEVVFSSSSTSVIIPMGNIGGGNYAVNQHFRVVQGDVK